MRFRIHPVLFSLLATSVSSAWAEEPLALRMESQLQTLKQDPQQATAFFEADRLLLENEKQVEAQGQVSLRQQGQTIQAEHVLYQRADQQLEAKGGVVLEQGGNVLSGESLQYNLGTHSGVLEQPKYQLAGNAGQGAADRVNIHNQSFLSLDNASYSTCKADDPAWQLKTQALEIDRERQVGVARHAKVEFMGLPILYTPWIDFALNGQRKSGFMTPTFGSTVQGGFEFTLPYYWNIARNYDATFSPRIMEKRGVQLNNEFRYLNANFNGELHLDVLPWDAVADRKRGRFAWQHQQQLPGRLSWYTNLNRVSDNNYFRDLGDAVNSTSQVNLTQETGLSFRDENWNATLRVQRFQTLQDSNALINAPYVRMPQLTVNTRQQLGDFDLSLAAEYVDFQHPSQTDGARLVLNPSASYKLYDQNGMYITPRLGLHSSRYVMGDNNHDKLPDTARHIPMFSVDSGLTLERNITLFGQSHLQTLEPRLFYVYVPYQDQSKIPNFDSAQADFSFSQMFTENRFFGSDRIGDANHLTLALTSRMLSNEHGKERLRLLLGQRFSFETPQVYLVEPTSENTRSNLLLAMDGHISDAWSLESALQFDPNQSELQRYNIATHYRPEAGKVINLGYRFLRDSLRHVDISAQWPLSAKWHGVGRWNYSLLDDRLLEGIIGLEYNRDCWMLRLVAQRFATSSLKTNTSFFVQLELNDLMKLGDDPLTMLKQSVPGYYKLNETRHD